MFTTHKTFAVRALTFEQALEQHPMVLEPTKLFIDRHRAGQLAKNTVELSELWEGLCSSIQYSHAQTIMPRCVDLTMPPEYAVVVRKSSGVTAAFAYCELAKALVTVRDLTDDLEVRAAMVKGWQEFERRRQEANNVQEGFGCNEEQSWLTMRDISDESGREELKQQMMAIALLAGRMYEKFGYQRRDQKNEDPEEAVGATIGGDLERVLPTELALLGDEETSDLQAMKILQDRAPIMQMQGMESKNRGPLVMLLDSSGSMHDGQVGYHSTGKRYHGRNTWCKAAAVALTRIAWSEDRPVRAVHFGTGTEVQEVPKDDYRAMFEMARTFLSGGTSFSAALTVGRAQVGDLAAQGFEGADIVLVTDGEESDYAAHTRHIDAMDVQGIKLWTVGIGCDIRQGAPVRDRAEKYTFAADRQLADPNNAVDLAEGLNQAAMGNPVDYTVN